MAEKVTLTRDEALQEAAYVAGLHAGYNMGVVEDRDGLFRAIESRVKSGYVGVLKKTRAK